MANITIKRTPDFWAEYWAGQSISWRSDGVSSRTLEIATARSGWAGYEVDLPATLPVISAALTVTLSNPVSVLEVVYTCTLCRNSNGSGGIASQTFTATQPGEHTFSFSSIETSVDKLYFVISANITLHEDGIYDSSMYVSAPTASVSYTQPDLSMGVSPESLLIGEGVTLDFGDTRLGQTVSVDFYYGSTKLNPDTFFANTNTIRVLCPEDWFGAAGVTGNSLSVRASAGDALGRSASASFTLRKPDSPVVALTTPTSGTKDGGQQIDFAWTISPGSGIVNGTQMEYSINEGLSWTQVLDVSKSRTTYTASASYFPAGRIYWRVRARNTLAGWGSWQQASFNVSYSAPTVTLTAPGSGTKDGSQQIDFAWTISPGSGTVNGTQMEYSSDEGLHWTALINTGSAATSASVLGGKFSAGRVLWRVRASNSNTGWGAWAQASFTVTYTPASVSLTTPTGGTRDGGLAIEFGWTITAGGGTITGTQVMYSTDDGLSWAALVDYAGAQTRYTAQAGMLPGGTLRWRVRARDSYAGWTDWKQASFTVTYAAPTVSLTSPTSGTRDGGEPILFYWSITAGSGSVTGTQMAYSVNDGVTWTTLVDYPGTETSYSAAAAAFPGGTLRWRVRAYDSYIGWSAWQQAGFTVRYSEVSRLVPVNSPTSGRINVSAARVWQAALEATGPVYEPFTVSQATFYWRAGESGAFIAISMTPSGSMASVSVPGGTFPSGTLQWYAEATDNTGRTTSTDTYTLTVLNALVEAFPQSPIDTIESGGDTIAFRWAYISLDGSAQSFAELQYSADGETWIDLHSVSGQETIWSAPADSFDSGRVYWRVRAYNEGGTAGPWSNAVSFTVFAAPRIAAVAGDGRPFLTVTWQVDSQLAYKLKIGDKIFGPYFGEAVRSYTLSEPLSDGIHRIAVAAQNSYGLWSPWVANDVSVVNVSGTAISILLSDEAAEISIAGGVENSPFLIYRNAKRIGRTTARHFTDRAALGDVEYFALQALEGGYYTKSNTVRQSYAVDFPTIAPLSGGEPLTLRLSENTDRAESYIRSREVAYTRYSGSIYPEAEIGEQERLTASCDVAFRARDAAGAAAFEAMIGMPVIFKAPGGVLVVGVMEGWQRRDPRFFKSYSFSVQQMDWGDFFDES